MNFDLKRAILVTGHYYESKRRAGFHWLADAYRRAGWDVIFMTVGISWLSYLRRDHRLQYPVRSEAGKLRQIDERLWSFVWFTPVHPVNFHFDLLNCATRPIVKGYKDYSLGQLETMIPDANEFVFESSYGLVLFERFKELNSHARYIYRVSDDLRLLRVHPLVREAEDRCAPKFDKVSVPSSFMFERFRHLPGAVLQHHGIRKDIYDACLDNPYPFGTVNAVFVGNGRFDYDFLQRAIHMFPDWDFHIVGPIPGLPRASNVHAYGEMPFEKTVPLVKWADIGLQTLAYVPGAECFTDSLKMIQYQYCRLPILAPEYLRSNRSGIFYYHPENDVSIKTALISALECDRDAINPLGIYSWDELVTSFGEGAV